MSNYYYELDDQLNKLKINMDQLSKSINEVRTKLLNTGVVIDYNPMSADDCIEEFKLGDNYYYVWYSAEIDIKTSVDKYENENIYNTDVAVNNLEIKALERCNILEETEFSKITFLTYEEYNELIEAVTDHLVHENLTQ